MGTAILLMTILFPIQDPAYAGGQGPGIHRELARARSAVLGSIHYRLRFDLSAGRREVPGRVEAVFNLAEETGDLALDFRGTSIEEMQLNGREISAQAWKNGRILLPAAGLRQGENRFTASFQTRAAEAGEPLNVFRDRETEEEILYTLLVPADAHRLFPCFDQPDLKAVFSLTLTLPAAWRAVANTDPEGPGKTLENGRREVRFEPTERLSTYLFAFAAGPFASVEAPSPATASLARPVRILVRPSRLDSLEGQRLLSMHERSLAWMEDYFGSPYPFGKLDAVLLPGFPYGGMEHAGAIFYRESTLVSDHDPSEVERLRRSTLIYHEVAHQWFGNLVTMEWFDDLWLKEGFATFVGFSALEALEPDREAWLRFHQTVKPPALRVDATSGTVPIFQELETLEDAKSVYGPIVYNKAPAVLRELEGRMGREAFRAGVRAFLEEHAWGSARWQDLAGALRGAGMEEMDSWSRSWILTRGMPRVAVELETDEEGRIASLALRQESVLGDGTLWPLVTEVLLWGPGEKRRRFQVHLPGARGEVREAVGGPVPDWILANPGDVAYGQFLPDPDSREALLGTLPGLEPPLLRSVAFQALMESVREAELQPDRLAALVLALLETERDPLTHPRLLAGLGALLGRYLPEERAAPLRDRAASLLLGQLEEGELGGLELETFRFLARHAPREHAAGLCRAVLGERAPPGLATGPEDRFLAAAALLALGDPGAAGHLDRLETEGSGDVARLAFRARAAAPDPAVKEEWFRSYLDPREPPEQWVLESLSFFHWPGQEQLTLPFLQKALEQVEWVKEHRKIFFMPAWIDAFVTSQTSPAAVEAVEAFLGERPDLPGDIRLKVLQSLDELRRTVRIRKRWQ